jgi:hypothetical protein
MWNHTVRHILPSGDTPDPVIVKPEQHVAKDEIGVLKYFLSPLARRCPRSAVESPDPGVRDGYVNHIGRLNTPVQQ